MPACVQALAAVHAADRYPANWPTDPRRWLTPDGSLGAWVATDGAAVLGHVSLARPGPALADVVGVPAAELAEVARLFVGVSARRGGLARDLLAHAAQMAIGDRLQPVLEVESGAIGAIALYERTGWRFVGSSVADWRTADGQPAVVRIYIGPSS
ncbi:MAG: GNAT family N-acetyltransferase [Catenulispora sp.]|nr:GNAT family N-acetyltransferase [Catenulispora sp.]